MPKETPEQKAARSAAIQEATKFAAEVPMSVARRAYEIMDMIAEVARKGNSNAVTDACVAMMAARSSVLGAFLNVKINLGSLKDADYVAGMKKEADELEKKACEKESELLKEINRKL
jgi:formiminotetrahydrofolate cyclodeaminase